MFDITTNQVIKIHKGDTSSRFSLFLNMGTAYEPIQYKFYPKLSITEQPDDMTVTVDEEKFYSQITSDGFFDFEYNYLYDKWGEKIGEKGWYLNQKKVELETYGISTEGSPSLEDHIVIAQFREHISEVYFHILDPYADLNDWWIKKTFLSSGETFTEFADPRIGTLDEEVKTVDSSNNIILRLASEDIEPLMAGEYCYQVSAKLYDPDNDEYTMNTVTNRLPIYIIDGEDSIIW